MPVSETLDKPKWSQTLSNICKFSHPSKNFLKKLKTSCQQRIIIFFPKDQRLIPYVDLPQTLTSSLTVKYLFASIQMPDIIS